jgi:hypothetical protein
LLKSAKKDAASIAVAGLGAPILHFTLYYLSPAQISAKLASQKYLSQVRPPSGIGARWVYSVFEVKTDPNT